MCDQLDSLNLPPSKECQIPDNWWRMFRIVFGDRVPLLIRKTDKLGYFKANYKRWKDDDQVAVRSMWGSIVDAIKGRETSGIYCEFIIPPNEFLSPKLGRGVIQDKSWLRAIGKYWKLCEYLTIKEPAERWCQFARSLDHDYEYMAWFKGEYRHCPDIEFVHQTSSSTMDPPENCLTGNDSSIPKVPDNWYRH